MKIFEFRRHSIKDGPTSAMIGPRGYALARAVGEQQLRGRGFTHFFASTYFRTHQTLSAFTEGAGDFRLKFIPEHAPIYVNSVEIQNMLDVCAKAEKRGEDMMQTALAHDPDLVQRTSMNMVNQFLLWSGNFPDPMNALIVGHSPSLEFLVYGFKEMAIPGLKECRGFRIEMDQARRSLEVDIYAHDLDPSAIRAMLFP